jgi:hypothetical protein
LKFINDQGVDVYAIILEIHDILGLPAIEPINTTYKGVGLYGLIHDVVAVLPLDDLTAFLDKKMRTKEFFMTLLTAIRSPVLMVNILCVYLIYVSCCLCYVHTSVRIIVMNALLLPIGHGEKCAILARIP